MTVYPLGLLLWTPGWGRRVMHGNESTGNAWHARTNLLCMAERYPRYIVHGPICMTNCAWLLCMADCFNNFGSYMAGSSEDSSSNTFILHIHGRSAVVFVFLHTRWLVFTFYLFCLSWGCLILGSALSLINHQNTYIFGQHLTPALHTIIYLF